MMPPTSLGGGPGTRKRKEDGREGGGDGGNGAGPVILCIEIYSHFFAFWAQRMQATAPSL